MKLPAKIRLAGYDTKITRSRAVWDVDGSFGDYDANKNTIRLAESDQFEGAQEEAGTAIHEWVHGMVARFNIRVPDEEALVENLESALVQSLRDNQAFILALMKALK
jgi:hypothetical protein